MESSFIVVAEIIIPILTIILGGLTAYIKANEKLRNSSIQYITQAEEVYKDSTKAGGQKFSWVVESLYNLVPRALRIIVTKSCIEKLVQSTFNGVEAYAKTQLDKAVDKYFENAENIPPLNNQETIDENNPSVSSTND